ncbi:RNA pseudouridine synthase 7 isoform X3 [Hevea brasiliensis]|uniref:RNA pseudouridine synthase 7 isoform X3 n=1 Tax=Hevea brasiliensis TaxID=3981 RepID=UPI0025D11AA0|nr:RNA pseudouridine synthase 7 isoform X3 [Hevea brasiliensis]
MEIVWQTPANPPEKDDYIFLNGRRHVRPYYFEFISYVKNRWAGKTIVDLFAEEFKGRPYDYYVSAVKCGRIQVDGEMVPVSYIVKPSQKISHFLHRHEPPVMAWDVSILQKDPDVVTICKPATVPVHPCGQYRKNTVVGILQADHGLSPLFPVHRLDRLVSGLLILARNALKADFFRQEVGDSCSDFPTKGKAACTKFTRISTNGTHSIVLCKPITGRTHQIRVHLQYTGHPIANDFLYLSELAANPSAEGTSADRAACSSSFGLTPQDCSSDKCEENTREDFNTDPMCTNCPNLVPKGYDVYEEGLCLHCVKYSGPGWVYECPYPDWAFLS